MQRVQILQIQDVRNSLNVITGLGIARYLTIKTQFDSLGLHSIRYRFD